MKWMPGHPLFRRGDQSCSRAEKFMAESAMKLCASRGYFDHGGRFMVCVVAAGDVSKCTSFQNGDSFRGTKKSSLTIFWSHFQTQLAFIPRALGLVYPPKVILIIRDDYLDFLFQQVGDVSSLKSDYLIKGGTPPLVLNVGTPQSLLLAYFVDR